MADISDMFSHIYTTETNLNTIQVKNGQIILCVDSGKLYIDHNSSRVETNDIIEVENQLALPLSPLNKFYRTKDTDKLYFYLDDAWREICVDLDRSRLLPENAEDGSFPIYENSQWKTISKGTFVQSVNGITTTDGQVTIPNATQDAAGLMAPEDKTKLDNFGSEGYLTTVATGAGLTGNGSSTSPVVLNISNYSTNDSIRLTSTAGSVSLLASETSEAAVYCGSNNLKINNTSINVNGSTTFSGGNYLKIGTNTGSFNDVEINGTSLNINATNFTFNTHQLNSANGLVQVNSDGKIPQDLIPDIQADVDLSNYTGAVGISAATGQTISLKQGTGGMYELSVILQDDEINIDTSAGMLNVTGYGVMLGTSSSTLQSVFINSSQLNLNVSSLSLNGNSLNTANGLVKLGSDGKIPSNLYDAGGDVSALEGRVTTLESTVGELDGALDAILGDFGSGASTDVLTITAAESINMATADLKLNGASLNAANGMVKLDETGKVPSSLLPPSSPSTAISVVVSDTEPENPTEGMIWIQP